MPDNLTPPADPYFIDLQPGWRLRVRLKTDALEVGPEFPGNPGPEAFCAWIPDGSAQPWVPAN